MGYIGSMWHPARGILRSCRSLVVGGSVSAAAILAHVAEGGHHGSWFVIVPMTIIVSAVSWLLASRRLSFTTLLALLILAQACVHLLSNWITGHPAGHHLGMLISHMIAATMCALVLRYGDFLLWLISALINVIVQPWRGFTMCVPTPKSVHAAIVAALVPMPCIFLGRSNWHRGPPVWCVSRISSSA